MSDFIFKSFPTILRHFCVFLNTGVKEQYHFGDMTLTCFSENLATFYSLKKSSSFPFLHFVGGLPGVKFYTLFKVLIFEKIW